MMITQTELDRQVLLNLAKDLIDASGITGPPIDLYDLAAAMRIPIVGDPTSSIRGRLCGSRLEPFIVIGQNGRYEREQTAIGHEIGERIRIEIRKMVNRYIGGERIEQLCTSLAALLLCPPQWFSGDCYRCNGDLIALKRIYSTASHELIARRIVEVSADASRCWMVDQGWWRLAESSGDWPRFPIEIEYDVRRYANRSGDRIDREKEGISAIGWAVHEPGWKREIVISRAI